MLEKMKTSAWSLICIALLDVVCALKSDPYRKVNCSIDETHHYEITINDMKKEVLVNCRNASLSLESVKECLQIRSADLLYLDSCNLHSSLSTTSLHNLKTLTLVNSLTEETFIIKSFSIETLFIQKAAAKTLRLENFLLLKHLLISVLDWETILGKPFRNLHRLRTLSLVNNRLEHLQEDTFYDLTQLLILNLSGNKLQTLPESLFKSTKKLDSLLLNRNRFLYFNSTVFSNLMSLRSLSLSENALEELPEELLTSNLELEHIDLSNNSELKELPIGFLGNSRKLKIFDMSNCGLSNLAVDTFRSCSLLRKIILGNNKLNNISHNTFFSFSLSYLDLSSNSLTSLPPNLFGSRHRLEYLNLSRNHFSRIPTNSFADMFSLIELKLADNEIGTVNAQDFDSLSKLKMLDLSNNRIKYFYSLGKAKNVFFLNLSFNSIQAFPNISGASYKIESVDLSNNGITHLSTTDISFAISSTIITIDLRRNKITSLHLDYTIGNLILYLGFNPFACNCSLTNFLRFLQSKSESYPLLNVADTKNLSCGSPAIWKGTGLTEITPFHLCPILSSCPINCRCYKMQDLRVLVNCSTAELSNIPTVLPPSTAIVHLENNRIRDFSVPNSKLWADVNRVYLDGNELTDATSWILPDSLKLLSLRKNNLTQLPLGLLEFVSNATSFTLDIRENPWICSCDFLSVKRWFMKNLNKLHNPEEVLCKRIVNLTAILQAIQDIPEDAFCQPPLQTNKTIQAILAAVLVSVSITILAIILFYYRYSETVLAYLYVHVPLLYCCSLSYVDRDKLYDAFVSYTAPDRETVLSLVDELENKPPYFQLCIHERDWLAGYPITSHIEMSVANSKKTVVILTKSYLESFWCETEFQAAYMQSLEDRIDRIIIIIKGDLPEPDTMPPDVQYLLASKTYLVWGERWFWEKLRYALPHYASSAGRKDIEKIEQVEGMISNIRKSYKQQGNEKVL